MHWLPGLLTLCVLIPLHSVTAAPILRYDMLETRQNGPGGRDKSSSSAQQFGGSPARSSSRNKGGQHRSSSVNGSKQYASKQNKQKRSSLPKSKSTVMPRGVAKFAAQVAVRVKLIPMVAGHKVKATAHKAKATAHNAKSMAKTATKERGRKIGNKISKAVAKGKPRVRPRGISSAAPRVKSRTRQSSNTIAVALEPRQIKPKNTISRSNGARWTQSSMIGTSGGVISSTRRTGGNKPKPKTGANKTNTVQNNKKSTNKVVTSPETPIVLPEVAHPPKGPPASTTTPVLH